MEGVEPAACLIHSFCNEIGSTAEPFASETAESFLGIRHGARIKPHVDQVGLPCHLLSGRTDKEYIVDIRPVEVDTVIISLAHVSRIESFLFERVGSHDPSGDGLFDLLVKLGGRADTDLLLAVLGAPDRERSAPETAAA